MIVLLAVDEDRSSYLGALRASQWLPEEATLVVLHVGPVPAAVVTTAAGAEPAERSSLPRLDIGEVRVTADDGALAGLDAAHRAAAMVSGRMQLATGEPSETIEHVARDIDADLIVVGTGDRSWVSKLLEPSVSKRVVERAPCSVLVVRTAPGRSL